MSDRNAHVDAHPEFLIRRGTVDDAALVAYQRACMFRDMGRVDALLQQELTEKCVPVYEDGFATGEYVSWFVHERGNPARVVAGAGVMLRTIPPYPMSVGTAEAHIADGKSAHIVNVYVEPEARRRGLARLLMNEIRSFADAERIGNVTLHASDEGRPLYEQLGFVATNEMRLPPRSFPG